MDMKGLKNGKKKISEQEVFAKDYSMSPTYMQMNMHEIMVMYGISNRFTAMLMSSYHTKTMKMNAFSSSHVHGLESSSANHNMESSGLGDTKLALLFGLVNLSKHKLIPSLGISAPTAKLEKSIAYSMQLGSGSFEFIPSIYYQYTNSNSSLGVQSSAIIRLNDSKNGYRLGNEYTINSWYSYELFDFFSSSIRVELSKANSIKGSDSSISTTMEPASNFINYGYIQSVAYIGGIVHLKNGILKGQRIGFEAGKPFYQNVNGVQMQTNWAINLAWSLTL
jgi:hypothetical protein